MVQPPNSGWGEHPQAHLLFLWRPWGSAEAGTKTWHGAMQGSLHPSRPQLPSLDNPHTHTLSRGPRTRTFPSSLGTFFFLSCRQKADGKGHMWMKGKKGGSAHLPEEPPCGLRGLGRGTTNALS